MLLATRVVPWDWQVTMAIEFSTETIERRAPDVPGGLGLSLTSLSVVTALSMAMFYGFGTIPFNARILVPLTSVAIGKSSVNTVVAAPRDVGAIAAVAAIAVVAAMKCLGPARGLFTPNDHVVRLTRLTR